MGGEGVEVGGGAGGTGRGRAPGWREEEMRGRY